MKRAALLFLTVIGAAGAGIVLLVFGLAVADLIEERGLRQFRDDCRARGGYVLPPLDKPECVVPKGGDA